MHARTWAAAAVLAHQFLLGNAPAAAQWIKQPTVGIPRTADGNPHLTAPAPRTAEGTADLSGLWILDGFGLATNIPDTELLPAAKALYQQRLQTYGHDDPIVHCLPEGPRTGLPGFDPLRIVQTRNLIVVLYEIGPYRQIHLDGRSLPVDPTPTWNGLGTWVVSVDGEELRIAISSGGGPQAVFARSDTVFMFPPVGGSVRFVTDARGVATGLVLTVVEGDLPGVKQAR